MNEQKSLRDCMSGKDFEDYAVKHGARIEHGHKHDKVVTTKGFVPMPRHGGRDLVPGLRCKIIKELIAIGISCFAIIGIIIAVL